MEKKRRQGHFKEKERVYSIPCRKGEELRFTVVEFDGKERADIRYFSESDRGTFPSPRGISLDPEKLPEVETGVRKLKERFAKK